MSASAVLYPVEPRPCENDKLKSLARNRKKTAPTWYFQKPMRVRTPAAGVQDFDSTGRFTIL